MIPEKLLLHPKMGKPSANGYNNDPMAITWTLKYHKCLQKYWNRLPSSLGTALVTLAVFILGSTIRGEWILILVHFLKAFNKRNASDDFSYLDTSINNTEAYVLFGIDLVPYYLKDWPMFLLSSFSISYLFYFGIGGFLHWYYYVRRRNKPEEWKCQPTKWMSPKLERHEIALGTISLTLGSFVSSIISCYVMNGGWTTIYYNISEYGWLWYIISWPVNFICQDYLTYWFHRFYHLPFLYKNFHKLHHKYKQPTAFSVTAIHPVEFLHMQSVFLSPMVLFPIHYTVFCMTIMYIYYHGIIDHSGINFKAYWWQPWQPDCIFHDNHHQYFHVNFGFNCELWDKIHETYRKKDRIYTENIYGGKGKRIEMCSIEELKTDLKERESENMLAYRGNIKEEQVSILKTKLKVKNK